MAEASLPFVKEKKHCNCLRKRRQQERDKESNIFEAPKNILKSKNFWEKEEWELDNPGLCRTPVGASNNSIHWRSNMLFLAWFKKKKSYQTHPQNTSTGTFLNSKEPYKYMAPQGKTARQFWLVNYCYNFTAITRNERLGGQIYKSGMTRYLWIWQAVWLYKWRSSPCSAVRHNNCSFTIIES